MHDDRLGRRRRWSHDLPQGQGPDGRSGERASERHAGMPEPTSTLPRLPCRCRSRLPLTLDAPHDARPETGPIGRKRYREGLPKRAPESMESVDLGLTASTPGNVDRGRPGGPGFQGTVEVGPEAPPRAETGQHIDWTGEEPPVILSAV